MIAHKLTAQNFRNLREVDFEPCENVNVLYGNNAQGKTNLIEALWLFSGVRSFRGSKDSEFIGFGENSAKLSLDFSSRGTDNNALINFSEHKSCELNEIKSDSVSSLAGSFCEVVFSPDHLNLVKQGPMQRRKFIDSAITEIMPRHAASISEYTKLLKQRNALLKDIPTHSGLLDTLPVWDEKLIKIGAFIIFTRLRYLARMTPKAAEIYNGIAANADNGQLAEELEISYETPSATQYPKDISDASSALPEIREKLSKEFTASLNQDLDCGYTKCGPHHDDLKISIGGIDARIYGSQGQQRSAVLAMKLSEAKVLRETIGEPPVLLLDDVMSELDPGRQNYILNNIGGCQVFITCCEPSGLDALDGGKIFKVEKGTITETKEKTV